MLRQLPPLCASDRSICHRLLPAYAVGAPVMAGLERRGPVAIAMRGFALGNLLAALAPSYAGLMAARLLPALSTAAFSRLPADMRPRWAGMISDHCSA